MVGGKPATGRGGVFIRLSPPFFLSILNSPMRDEPKDAAEIMARISHKVVQSAFDSIVAKVLPHSPGLKDILIYSEEPYGEVFEVDPPLRDESVQFQFRNFVVPVICRLFKGSVYIGRRPAQNCRPAQEGGTDVPQDLVELTNLVMAEPSPAAAVPSPLEEDVPQDLPELTNLVMAEPSPAAVVPSPLEEVAQSARRDPHTVALLLGKDEESKQLLSNFSKVKQAARAKVFIIRAPVHEEPHPDILAPLVRTILYHPVRKAVTPRTFVLHFNVGRVFVSEVPRFHEPTYFASLTQLVVE